MCPPEGYPLGRGRGELEKDDYCFGALQTCDDKLSDFDDFDFLQPAQSPRLLSNPRGALLRFTQKNGAVPAASRLTATGTLAAGAGLA